MNFECTRQLTRCGEGGAIGGSDYINNNDDTNVYDMSDYMYLFRVCFSFAW